MALIAPQTQEDEDNEFSQPQGVQQAPAGADGALPSTGGGVAGEAPAAPPNVGTPTQFGSAASKLSDYLRVNAPQVASEGQKIASQLGQKTADTRQSIDTAAQGFNAAVQAGYTPADPSLVQSAAEDPTAFLKNPQNVAAFNAQRKGEYTGPSGFESSENFGDITQKVNDAIQDASTLSNREGLQGYLTRGRSGTYTPGMGTLDSALLRGNPEAFSAIRTAAQEAPTLTSYLSSATEAANSGVKAARDAAESGRAGIEEAFFSPGGAVERAIQAANDPSRSIEAMRTTGGLNALLGSPIFEGGQDFAGSAARQDLLDKVFSMGQPTDPLQKSILQDANTALSAIYNTPSLSAEDKDLMIQSILNNILSSSGA